MSSRPAEQFKQERLRLRSDYDRGMRGLAAARRLTEAVDRTVEQTWLQIGPPSGASVVAVGGYGRRELCPASDIDLIVLHAKSVEVSPAVKALSYEMWDAGLELAPSVLTVKQALSLAKRDFDSVSSFLDARLVSGDRDLYEEWQEKSLNQARRDGPGFLSKLSAATAVRHARYGDAGAELEPDIKGGRGALRDIASIQCLGKFLGPPLSAETSRSLDEALEFLITVRQSLHWQTGRRTDVLLMQHQKAVSQDLHMDEYALMHKIYERCRPVAFTLSSLLQGECPFDGAARAFIDHFTGGHDQWNEVTRKAFLAILAAGSEARDAFKALDHRGALIKALPEWNRIRCMPQRNIYHRFAVDVHSFETVCALVGLTFSADELIRQVALDARPAWDTMLLSALFHDIGKGSGFDHCEAGETLAAKCVERIGLKEPGSLDVPWLVRNHLILSETATRRDIADEGLIIELAEKVGSPQRLAMLFLLSVADAIATGPQAWTPWKATLVSQLFAEVNHLLEQGELVGRDATLQAHRKTTELKQELGEFKAEAVDAHLSQMPRAWLLSQPIQDLAHQSRSMLNFSSAEKLSLQARRRSEEGVWEVVVVAMDRPGLFNKVAGSLALHGLNVVAAQIFTREDGLALEIFQVEAISDEAMRFEHVRQDAVLALEGSLDLDSRLAAKRLIYSQRVSKGKQEPPQVVVDNRSSDFYTVIEVHAEDRVGLLYSITAALAELGLDIHLAKVATYAQDVVDSFYVRDRGQKVTDDEQILQIERALLDKVTMAPVS